MSRKTASKSRPAPRGAQTLPAPAGGRTNGNGEAPGAAKAEHTAAGNRATHQQRFWLEVVAIRISRLLGSLQVAIVLLLWFAFVLAIGTMVESWYSGKIAQELVYRTWWFKLLLFLLAINIFFAAAKKWPWKKHQTGFLITHVGLLTLVAGGVVTSFSGTDGMMALIDTSQADLQRSFGFKQQSDQAVLTDEATIRLRMINPGKGDFESREFRFESGSLPWRPDEYLTPQVHPLLRVLNWLDHPFPRSWEADLGGGRRLTVLGYYPHARQEEYSPAKSAETGVPAVKLKLKSSKAGRIPNEPWIALSLHDQVADLGPALIEMLGRCPTPLLGEFMNPPPARDLGDEGQLVLFLDGKLQRIRVDKSRNRPVELGGHVLKILRYIPDFEKQREGAIPSSPALEFELTKDGKTTRYFALARYAGILVPMNADGKRTSSDPNDVRAWYHPPDYRYGRGGGKGGLLQLAVGEQGQLYYRSFCTSAADPTGFGFERSGEAKADHENHPIWQGMNWEFQVKEYLPHAVAKSRLVPENARPGLQTERLVAALRCLLTTPDGKSDEFWLSQGGAPQRVVVGKEAYDMSYNILSRPLDFDVKLLRAEQTVDAGTQQAATYTSYVQLTDEGAFSAEWEPKMVRGLTNLLGLTSGGDKIVGQDRVITMNYPLHHRGYKLYQSGYDDLQRLDENQKPVSYSAFTVSRDPGLWLKYLGSSMLALGIACMFYMKAYFFKPRRRPALAR